MCTMLLSQSMHLLYVFSVIQKSAYITRIVDFSVICDGQRLACVDLVCQLEQTIQKTCTLDSLMDVYNCVCQRDSPSHNRIYVTTNQAMKDEDEGDKLRSL